MSPINARKERKPSWKKVLLKKGLLLFGVLLIWYSYREWQKPPDLKAGLNFRRLEGTDNPRFLRYSVVESLDGRVDPAGSMQLGCSPGAPILRVEQRGAVRGGDLITTLTPTQTVQRTAFVGGQQNPEDEGAIYTNLNTDLAIIKDGSLVITPSDKALNSFCPTDEKGNLQVDKAEPRLEAYFEATRPASSRSRR
jgi:hypothetical protein